MHPRRTNGRTSLALPLVIGLALAGMTVRAADQDQAPSPSQPAAEQQSPASPQAPAAQPPQQPPAAPPESPAAPQPEQPAAPQSDPPAAPRSEPSPSEPAAPQAQASVAPAAQVEDEELEKFVRSVAEVNKIQTSVKEKLPTLQGAEAERVQQESNAEMAKIIQGCELEVERYNELARAVSSSPELSQRFQAKQQELASRGNVAPCVADAAPESR